MYEAQPEASESVWSHTPLIKLSALAHDEMRLIEYRCVAPAHARPRDDMRGLYAPGGGLARLSRVTVLRRSDDDEKEAERRSGRA